MSSVFLLRLSVILLALASYGLAAAPECTTAAECAVYRSCCGWSVTPKTRLEEDKRKDDSRCAVVECAFEGVRDAAPESYCFQNHCVASYVSCPCCCDPMVPYETRCVDPKKGESVASLMARDQSHTCGPTAGCVLGTSAVRYVQCPSKP